MQSNESQDLDNEILKYIDGKGVPEASAHVLKMINDGSYSLYYSVHFVDCLLKKGEAIIAGEILKALAQSGVTHPLLAELQSTQLWCVGKRNEAILFAKKSAEKWRVPYLYNQLRVLYELHGEKKKAARYFRMILKCDELHERSADPAGDCPPVGDKHLKKFENQASSPEKSRKRWPI